MSSNSPTRGECKLCHTIGELRDSHFIPKAAYKIIKQSEDESPVVVNAEVGLQTDSQMKDYVLCPQCEERFNKNGESWVMKYCSRNAEGFRLKKLIAASKPLAGNGLKVYSAALLPEIDLNQLTYFASSILWRAAVHKWKIAKKTVEPIYLGPYREELRRFLLAETLFPQKAVIWVSIVPEEKLWNVFIPPYGEKVEQCTRYKFVFLGISFMLFFGSQIDSVFREMCTLRSEKHFIYTGEPSTEMITRDFGRVVAKSRPVGSLRNVFEGNKSK
jgi:hypothetical protein